MILASCLVIGSKALLIEIQSVSCGVGSLLGRIQQIVAQEASLAAERAALEEAVEQRLREQGQREQGQREAAEMPTATAFKISVCML